MGKTGTSAFGTALQILGYRVIENVGKLVIDWNEGNYEELWKVANNYDAFEDYPWPYIYKEFDKKYPNSKFVFVERPEEEWIIDILYQNMRSKTIERRAKVDKRNYEEYGFKYLATHKEDMLELYRNHNKNVKEYFKDREDFLEIEWNNYKPGSKDTWKILCKFLDKPIIEGIPFPNRKNQSPHLGYERMYRIAKANPEKFYGW